MDRPIRKERPLIVIDTERDVEGAFWEEVIVVARKLEWQLFNIQTNGYDIPDHIQPAGAICTVPPEHWVAKQIRKLGIPCVRHGHHAHKLDDRIPAVTPDRAAIGRLAAEHFASRGFKHVANIIHIPRVQKDDAHEALRDRAAELGMEFHGLEKPLEGEKTMLDYLVDWLPQLPKPIGIQTYHEFLANKVFLAAQMVDLMVPQEIGILAARNSFHCESCPVPISAVEWDWKAAGQEAAYLLKRIIDGESPQSSIRIPPQRLVLRQSTDVLAVPDMVVAKALDYMWEYYDWPLSVDDVAMEVNVSRSTLERRFRRHLGRGVSKELRRKRLEKCRELLKASSMNLDEVMRACGFGNRAHFHRIFLDKFGMTPGNYRRANSANDS